MSLSRQFRSHRCGPRPVTLRAGFTLIEIVIALAVLGTMAAGCYIGFNAINEYSVSSRLYTEAQSVCQNQIDLILSKEPFDVTTNPQKIPSVLALGTFSEFGGTATLGGVPEGTPGRCAATRRATLRSPFGWCLVLRQECIRRRRFPPYEENDELRALEILLIVRRFGGGRFGERRPPEASGTRHHSDAGRSPALRNRRSANPTDTAVEPRMALSSGLSHGTPSDWL